MPKLKIMVVADHRVAYGPAMEVFRHMISSRAPEDVQILAFCDSETPAEDGELYDSDWEIAERAAIMGCDLCIAHTSVSGLIKLTAGGVALFIAPAGVGLTGADNRVRHMHKAITKWNAKPRSKSIRIAFVNSRFKLDNRC